MSDLAIIAGQGDLPAELAARHPQARICALAGFAPDLPGVQEFRLERLVPFLDGLVGAGIHRVIFAGAVTRPALNPEAFDPKTATLVPRIAMAMQSGDDAALREVIAIFEEWGLHVLGLSDLAADLIPGAGVLAGSPTPRDEADAARAADILSVTGPLDIGQGAVVAGGLCLAIETLPGTAAMLDFVATHRGGNSRGGVLFKAPKPGQDMRIDMPAIGPDTVAQAARAGLSGIAWAAGQVVMLRRAQTVQAAHDAGLFLWARGQGPG